MAKEKERKRLEAEQKRQQAHLLKIRQRKEAEEAAAR